jgi:hypothetical protein
MGVMNPYFKKAKWNLNQEKLGIIPSNCVIALQWKEILELQPR